VMIQAGSATGSGFVLDSGGRIMTNNHVVAAADGGRIRVVFADGRRLRATLVGRSPSYDIAVVQVRASGLRPLPIGDSDASRVGESVIAVGSPLGLPGTVTQGIVSAVDRPVVVNNADDADAPTAYIDAIQTDAPINPGNSGGPLIDSSAKVIGVNSAILTLGSNRSQAGNIGLGFAIPINQAIQIGQLLIKNGKATYPVIGAKVAAAEEGVGVMLSAVDKGGPAATAGLRQGDMITKINGVPVEAADQLVVAIRTHRPYEVVVLDYRRGEVRGKARVVLGSREG
jgi:putative serine protease PepD